VTIRQDSRPRCGHFIGRKGICRRDQGEETESGRIGERQCDSPILRFPGSPIRDVLSWKPKAKGETVALEGKIRSWISDSKIKSSSLGEPVRVLVRRLPWDLLAKEQRSLSARVTQTCSRERPKRSDERLALR